MDASASIYANILNTVFAHMAKLNPQLTVSALKDKANLLDGAGVKYTIQYERVGNILTIIEANESQRAAFYNTIVEYIAVFENQYGINEIWDRLKGIMVRVFQAFRDSIRDLKVEMPIVKYKVDYRFEAGVFDFKKRDWTNEPVLVTNHNLVFMGEKSHKIIPLDAVQTVGREIYVGYVGANTEAHGGVIRAIDYKMADSALSCAVISTKENMMKDLLNVVKAMRSEYRRLNENEARVLMAVYNNVPPDNFPSQCGLSLQEAQDAFKRMVKLGYADASGHITSYGLNAAAEIIQAKK